MKKLANQNAILSDFVLKDSILSFKIMLIAAAAISICALLEITVWPWHGIELNQGKNAWIQIYNTLSEMNLLSCILFWSTKPTQTSQKIVFIMWVLLFTLCYFFQIPTRIHDDFYQYLNLIMNTLAIPCLFNLFCRVTGLISQPESPLYEARLKWLIFMVLFMIVLPLPFLQLNPTLNPQTFDLYALHFDVLIGGKHFIPTLLNVINSSPVLTQMVTICYVYTPITFLLICILQLKGRPAQIPSAILLWILMTGLPMIAFQFFPITGPGYVDANSLSQLFQHANLFPLKKIILSPAPRNGMPSMHFGWVFIATLVWWQMGTRLYSKLLMVMNTFLTAMATLYLGEHYSIDLIVAIPFSLSCYALSLTNIPLKHFSRKYPIIIGFFTWFIWILCLRSLVPVFIENAWLAYLLVFFTLMVISFQGYCLSHLKYAPIVTVEAFPKLTPHDNRRSQKFGFLFFASGFAALIYQVLFAKELALTFGSTSLATITVLATFLGGMALGAYMGGKIAEKTHQPIKIYAWIETAIGLYCLITPWLFHLVQFLYIKFAAGAVTEDYQLTVLRVLLGGLVLFVPTFLMGTTLPILAKSVAESSQPSGKQIAWLYFTNTLGAAVGALLSTYWIIPIYGIQNTTILAVAINIAIGFVGLQMAKTLVPNFMHTPSQPAPILQEKNTTSLSLSNRQVFASLLSLTLGGILSLGLEVVYVHLLAMVAGNSVYAFGLMLTTFLLGLSLGGEVGRQIIIRQYHSTKLLPFVFLGLSITLMLSLSMWNGIPDFFASYATYPLAHSFVAREAIRGYTCGLIMIFPALLIGIAYTFAMDILTLYTQKKKYHMLGIGAMLNTIGNVIGVLIFGFYIIPHLEGFNSIKFIALGAFILGIFLLILFGERNRLYGLLISICCAGVLWKNQFIGLNYDQVSSGANTYFVAQNWGKVIAHAESLDGGLTTVNEIKLDKTSVLTLLTNGKFQGNNVSTGEVQAQIGFAIIPLLHSAYRNNALVIGYGTGTTSRVLHDAGFKKIDIVELNQDIVEIANQFFTTINHLVSKAPNVMTHITDGRHFLLLTPHQYDLISIEISSIWFSGAATFYNQEFYALAKQHLTPNGILQQWVQLHHLSPIDIAIVIASLRHEFRYVSLYIMGQQGILVATNAPTQQHIDSEAVTLLNNTPLLKPIERWIGVSFTKLDTYLFLNSTQIDTLISNVFKNPSQTTSTDDNLILEYSTPRGNVNDTQKSLERNLEFLTRFSTKTRI